MANHYSSDFRMLATLALFLISCLCRPASANPKVEGRISKPHNANGYFDVRVQVWDESYATPRLLQTIEVPKVWVQDGHFEVSLNTTFAADLEKNLSVKILSRGFESFEAYKPSELVRFGST